MSPFIRGVIIFFLGMSFFFTFVLLLGREPERDPQIHFKVITQYKGCDVVEMNYEQRAKYSYFLDCRETR